ncbi:MAG TPA: helix-turn-helix transcriptional regulator [Blastocatellia bacterium]|nr:helix-turn-helix transcriptional regulator [Blastocatellia bacterium]
MIKRDGLCNYVRSILKEKELTFSDVERRSEKSISDSYVHAISSGNIGNPSLDKLSALARGLGVTETQLFFAAFGLSLVDLEEFDGNEVVYVLYKYRELSVEDRTQLRALLAILDREIDRLLLRNGHPQSANSSSPQPEEGQA